MLRIIALFALLVLGPVRTHAQNRQFGLRAAAALDNVEILDSRIDGSGAIIHVGRLETRSPGGSLSQLAVAIKTNADGNVIWTRVLNGQPTEAVKVRMAENGDYLILAKNLSIFLWRLSPSGTQRACAQIAFGTFDNSEITSIAALPGGEIGICGYNNFNGPFAFPRNSNGFFLRLDSVGNVLNPPVFSAPSVVTYGFYAPSWNRQEYYIEDMVRVDSQIYFAGSYSPSPGYPKAIVIRTDRYGLNPKFVIVDTGFRPDSKQSSLETFSSIAFRDGKLFLTAPVPRVTNGMFVTETYAMFAVLDTALTRISGTVAGIPNRSCWHTRLACRDTADWIISFQAGLTSSPYEFRHGYFFGSVQSGVLAKARHVVPDSGVLLNGLALSSDTMLLSGGLRRGVHTIGFVDRVLLNLPDSLHCKASDSSLQAMPFTLKMVPMGVDPFAFHGAFAGNLALSTSAGCTAEEQICGASPCAFGPFTDSISIAGPTVICPGDTIRLQRHGRCCETRWYRDTTLVGRGDQLILGSQPDLSGSYSAVSGFGTCTDTSNLIVVLQLRPDTPKIRQQGDTLIASGNGSLQWLDSAATPIPGATDTIFLPGKSCQMQVQLTDSNGCTTYSQRYGFILPEDTALNIPGSSGGQFRIAPNPATRYFDVSAVGQGPFELSFITTDGKIVAERRQPGKKARYDLSTLGLSGGMYQLKISGRGGTSWHRIIVIQ